MSDRLSIAHIIYGLKYGGAEKLLIPLAAKLDPERFRVIVVALTCGGPVEEELRSLNINVRVLRRDGRFSIFDLARLIQLMKEQDIDIIHTHLQNADIWAGLAAKLCRIKHISTFHGAYFKNSAFEFLKQRLRVILPDKIIAVSENTASHCIRRLKVNPNKVKVIYNGVDSNRFKVGVEPSLKKREIGISDNTIVLSAFGRLEIEKGHRYLIEAVSYLKTDYPNFNSKITVLIVGEGRLKKELMQMASELGVEEEVKFLGERDDIAELLGITDIVVIPSLSEGFSIVALEAMAAGKPVVATNVGGMPELITNETDGLLISPGDKSAVASAILALIENKDLAYRLSYAAKEKVTKNFSEEGMLAKIMQVYEDLMQRKKAGITL